MMECLFTRTHVICATFWDQTILIGEGNTVSAFSSTTLNKIGFHVAFASCNVHGIRTVCESHSSCVCAVFGSRFLTIVKLEPWSAPSMSFQVLLQPVMFDDWIWDIQWLAPDDGSFDPLDEKCMNVAICFGHNGVSLWDWKSKERLAWAVCTESCILYAGHFVGSTWNSLMVAVGTVFKEVILWAPSQCLAQVPARVVHRLSGHQGVIFSVNFNVPRRLLCSTSDDRSLRVYRFHEHPSLCQAGAEDLSLEQLSRGWFSSLHVLYGHESRVWRAAALSSCYISVGEDSSICFWGTQGNLITKMTAPGGGSIWCLAVNEDETLAVTGSSGSAVCIWHLSDVLGHASKTTWIEAFTVGSNFPRTLALVDCSGTMSLLVVTNEGRLLRWVLSCRELSMEALLQRDYLVSYSVLSVSPRRNYFAVGSIKGHILVFKCTGGANITLLAEDLVHDGRVHSIRWVSDTSPAFLSSGPNGFMILTQLADDLPSSDEPGSVESLGTFLLPRGRQRWATAAILLPPCLFVGDRSGSVHAFLLDDDQDMVEPFRTFQAIHGCNGVTDMKHTEDTLVTSGRDGRILLFSVKNQELRFLRTFWCLTSLEWIGQMVVEGKDLLLCGYHTSNFVVWNTTQQRAVLTVDCGGGHRSWDFATTASLEGIFVCLKMGKIMLHRSSLKDTLQSSCIRAPLHKKKISAICHLGNEERSPGVPQAYIVTAGEDNIITVSQVTLVNSEEKSNVTQKVVCRLHGHISSVKALAVCKASNLEPSERLLASVGGRAQMILWKVQASKRCSSESEELLNHRLWSLDKGCQRHFKAFPAKDPLARYMDVCVWEEEPLEFRIATVASDTYLRVFGYSWKEDLTLLVSVAVGEHCLFKVLRTELVTRPKSSLLLTAGNDGMLRFWQLRGADEEDEGRTECRLLDTFRRHQSGINALDLLVHDNIFTVVSGGDDNSLIVTNSVITEEGAVSELDEMTVANAHDAQITGALFLDAEGKWLMSVGIDQRLRTWHRSSSSVQEHCSRISCVPDLAALICWKKPNGDILVAIAGEGLEITLHENILAAEQATTAGQFIA